MADKVDYLIVGQGIAGTFLSYQLMAANKKIKVIDAGFERSSSWVAAGVINPLVLKRLTITWRADEFLKYNQLFYSGLESFLGKQYYFQSPLFKLIKSEDEKHFWKHRYEKASLEPYLNLQLKETEKSDIFSSNFSLGEVKNCAWLDLKTLMSDYREYLKSNQLLVEKEFDFNALDGNQYESIEFEKLVFCEGAAVVSNPYFRELPFSLNKGELLTIKAKELKVDSILKKKVFILPLGDDNYKVGATYGWKWNDHLPSSEKREQLISFLKEIITVDFEIMDHEAGIRPAVKDRRPLLGKHSNYPYYIFNGLGSRGAMMAPLLSQELIEFIEKGKKLHPETDINRF
jgi:glycine/D-amino acid oxidase-like deaminating enzyme